MTRSQIKQAALSIWKMRQPAFVQRQRQVEARREIEFRRIETALWAAIGTEGNEGRGVQSALSLSAFAKRLGKGLTVVSQNAQAATVYRKVSTQVEGFTSTDRAKHLTEIHAAPEPTWAQSPGSGQAGGHRSARDCDGR